MAASRISPCHATPDEPSDVFQTNHSETIRGQQTQDQSSSAKGLPDTTSRRWLPRTRNYIISTLHDNFWTLTAFLVGFILVAINSVQFPTECDWGLEMEYHYCSRLTVNSLHYLLESVRHPTWELPTNRPKTRKPRRLSFDKKCQESLPAGDPCSDTIFGRRLNQTLQEAFSLAPNPERMEAVDRLFSVAFVLTYLLNPRIMENARGVAPFTTPLVCLCVMFEEKTLHGMLSTFDRVVEHVVLLRVLMAMSAWWRGGKGESLSKEQDEEKNLVEEED